MLAITKEHLDLAVQLLDSFVELDLPAAQPFFAGEYEVRVPAPGSAKVQTTTRWPDRHRC